MLTQKQMRAWLQAFLPNATGLSPRERLRSGVGAAVALTIAGLSLHCFPGFSSRFPLLIAPMGASSVLLFAVPASPLAQPWSVIGGNVIAAIVGVTCGIAISNVPIAGAVAVSVAILAMFAARCVHPPAGAVALTAVFGGAGIHGMGYAFAIAPVAMQSTMLVSLAIVYHSLTGHRYPHRVVKVEATEPADASMTTGGGFTRKDLEAVLARRNELIDVDIDDLEVLLRETQLAACRRTFQNLTCADIMTTSPLTVLKESDCSVALKLLERHAIKALPVRDANHQIVGIVTRYDIQRASGTVTGPQSIGNALGWLLPGKDNTRSVGSVMTTRVCTAKGSDSILDLLPTFSTTGHHHIPVVDEGNHVIGMITESDLIAGLHAGTQLLQLEAA
ncbi:HPP family protein [Pandoraea terrigena]|nr:HPP family protein [Pandoraea terrigena]